MAVHPGSGSFVQLHADHGLLGAVLYLMCDDLPSFVRSLKINNVSCTPVTQAEWGIRTTLRLPSDGEIGLYQPTHPTAIGHASAG